jgi:hypothetical protein
MTPKSRPILMMHYDPWTCLPAMLCRLGPWPAKRHPTWLHKVQLKDSKDTKMKIGEILRAIADKVDQLEARDMVSEPEDDIQNFSDPEEVIIVNVVDQPKPPMFPVQ